MHKGSKSLKALLCVVMVCTFFISCATLSPFVDKSEGYSFLGASVPKSETLTFFVKTDFLKEQESFKNNPLVLRSDYATLVVDNNALVYGGLEGRFVADSIRFATGKNRVEQNGFTFVQSDSGLFLFSNGDIKKTEETLVSKRQIYRSREEMEAIFENDISIMGEDVSSNTTSYLFNADMPFKNISLTLNKQNGSDMSLSGEIECYSKEEATRLVGAFKLWIIGVYRREGKVSEIKGLNDALNVYEYKLLFNSVSVPEATLLSLFSVLKNAP